MKALAIALIFLACSLRAAAADRVSAELLADTDGVEPGMPFMVGVRLRMTPQWHVYWINPGDTGIPTKITFTLPDGFKAGDVQFPVPRRFVMPGGIVAFGYEDEVMFLATITPRGDLKPGSSVVVRAKTQWLVCDKDECVPGHADSELNLRVTSSKPHAANEDEFAKWCEQIPQANGQARVEVQVDAAGGQFKSATGTITLDWKIKLPEKVEWFPIAPDQLLISPTDIKTEGNVTTIGFKAEALPGEKITDASFSSVVAYTIGGKRAGALVSVKIELGKIELGKVGPGPKGS